MDQRGNKSENGMAHKRKLTEAANSMDLNKLPKSPKLRCGLPAELANELFAALPLKYAFGLIAKMPNGLLARNIRRMVKNMKMAMNNKWNGQDCGPMMAISEGGLLLTYSGTDWVKSCVRAIRPISKLNLAAKNPYIVYYFEVEIIKKAGSSFSLGFCDKQFPLEGRHRLGWQQNSIGIENKNGIKIDFHCSYPFFCFPTFYFNFDIDGFYRDGDVAGIGIVHNPANYSIQCFSTCNGIKLVTEDFWADCIETVELFPAITLSGEGDSFRVNFGGANEWRYNPFHKLFQ